ncbi:MAG: hypothetical protein JWO30_3615 [Fibrobacteres bacterium]|nr:hypothetical protein [Fibrobacterota bacterium]
MKKITLLLVLSLAMSVRAYEEEYDESFHANDNKNIYMEIPMIGNGFARVFPSRILSLKADVTSQFGLVAEPLLGYGLVQGYGSTAGFYYRNGKNFSGLKYALTHIDGYGLLHEFFYDYQWYYRTKPGINLSLGFSAGVGMTHYGDRKHEIRTAIYAIGINAGYNKTFYPRDYDDEVKIEIGPTFRLHCDLAYLFKYN